MNSSTKNIGRLHVITDTAIQNRFTHAEIAVLAARGGADCIQLRDKKLSREGFQAVAQEVLAACRHAGVPLIINDYADVAADIGADGVHLGRTDMSIPEAREMLGPDKIIGGSAGTTEELARVEREGADYAGFGHIFTTSSKQKGTAPLGVKTLQEAVRSVRIPVIAIGGIDAGNLPEVISTGVWGVAVIGAVCGSNDPCLAAQKLGRIVSEYGRTNLR